MMQTLPLFGKSSPAAIARTIQHDWDKFSYAAFMFLGRVEIWDAALEEVDLTEQDFVRQGLDPAILDPLFELLVSRLPVMPDRLARFEQLMETLAIPAPHIVEKVKRKLAMTPEEFRRAEYQEWAQAQRAESAAKREAKWNEQARTSVATTMRDKGWQA